MSLLFNVRNLRHWKPRYHFEQGNSTARKQLFLPAFFFIWGMLRGHGEGFIPAFCSLLLETALMCSFYRSLFSKWNWFLSLAFSRFHGLVSTRAALDREGVLFPPVSDNFSSLRLVVLGQAYENSALTARLHLLNYLITSPSICAKHAWMGWWNAGRMINMLILTTKQACGVHIVCCRESCWSTALCTVCVVVHLLLPLGHVRPLVLRELLYEG